ncbi:hypothetical protein BpHYR1_036684 [Brachionus plicatilis]|uniref:Uncharacterized protein n=1 Tax=Brachionus plicatilis TaxID=10195 RepID=A0A3M7QLP8_BRAPC|nr:hypothetical protein BpHYR1_036684 [Brachionus plicatilis]
MLVEVDLSLKSIKLRQKEKEIKNKSSMLNESAKFTPLASSDFKNFKSTYIFLKDFIILNFFNTITIIICSQKALSLLT